MDFDIKECSSLQEGIARDKCIYGLAVRERDIRYCPMIGERWIKRTCAAIFTRNKEICSLEGLDIFGDLCMIEVDLVEQACVTGGS